MPKFMLIMRASPRTDSGTPPSSALIDQMMGFYTDLKNTGVIVSADGFLPSSVDSFRLTFPATAEGEIRESKGPFPANEIFSGFWIIKAKDVDEALEWARKCPLGGRSVDPEAGEAVLEIRRIADIEDFGEEMTAEQREKHGCLTKEEESRKQGLAKSSAPDE
ncbi:hypothetical protein NA57DRAFT_51514 [Rhizodiscina lignyota]|uniref:YCII-related domain-containing protein n=1 Tax=Rhizodiscina lignyota TaxID=1504668 RepID=A0A9P4IRG2_9PEZI|nr:hypothetical protein NA57DRAFT_51514 [Rhizodiscina lignyota]